MEGFKRTLAASLVTLAGACAEPVEDSDMPARDKAIYAEFGRAFDEQCDMVNDQQKFGIPTGEEYMEWPQDGPSQNEWERAYNDLMTAQTMNSPDLEEKSAKFKVLNSQLGLAQQKRREYLDRRTTASVGDLIDTVGARDKLLEEAGFEQAGSGWKCYTWKESGSSAGPVRDNKVDEK